MHVAEVKAMMQGQHNSTACLAARTCLPLGGHTILAMLPPLPHFVGRASSIPGNPKSPC